MELRFEFRSKVFGGWLVTESDRAILNCGVQAPQRHGLYSHAKAQRSLISIHSKRKRLPIDSASYYLMPIEHRDECCETLNAAATVINVASRNAFVRSQIVQHEFETVRITIIATDLICPTCYQHQRAIRADPYSDGKCWLIGSDAIRCLRCRCFERKQIYAIDRHGK